MINLEVDNVNRALAVGLRYLYEHGEREDSRNGTVLVSPCPITTTYLQPTQRVLFSPMRDANPFFHLMEALWMLSGRRDLAWPKYFNQRFGSYSDDGKIVWGAYGWRWREFFGYSQLHQIAQELRANPQSRRAVLAMWNAAACPRDLPTWPGDTPGLITDDLAVMSAGGKDVPCNTHAYFDVRHGKLNVTVCCRSNDILWGAYGTNAVHFSMLLEIMAALIGVPVGVYRQMSNNYHAYTDVIPLEKFCTLAEDAAHNNLYAVPSPNQLIMPLVHRSAESWLRDLHLFMDDPMRTGSWDEAFFPTVAQPMYEAWTVRKERRGSGHAEAMRILADDWRIACTEWIERREK